MKNSAITCQNLSFAYQRIPVLEQVSFSVKKGEFFGLIGPNGGGKTTLLKLIMGFLAPTLGTIKTFSPQKIAYVPQAIQLDRQFPISLKEMVLQGRLSHLTWWGKYRQKDRIAADKAIEQVDLTDLKGEAFCCLSGGQLQRALIARALASEPDILLLDEPTANVDQETEANIYKLLKSLKEKITILMVSHDLEVAIDLFDQILTIQRTVTALKPEEVCKHFKVGLYHKPLVK